ncbi:MAG: hypothetical protein CL489_00885 [Acidobacteria bacterium]|jgi:hypothetical protein|nr:hypothetical protein [Acidobacteriota bacterium]|tara:strand:+ start:1004 stop:1654 length:651 start_codon:yes stop_codon:yes gene_type:complete
MAYDLMHGAQFAKSYVNEYLKLDIPTRLVSYRNGWDLNDGSLPDIELFLVHEPIALDHWPTIITVALSTGSFEQIGMVSGHPEFRVGYSMRTYVWVRTEGSEETTIMRDRLTTVVRAALLDRPCLRATDPRSTWQAQIDQDTMREEFSDLTLLKGDRVMAGSYIAYELTINEIVAREKLGIVDEEGISIGVKNVGIGEDMVVAATTSYTTTGGYSE